MLEYIQATSTKEYEIAAMLFKEYATAINIDLQFQRFDEELSALQDMYRMPQGGIILCALNKEWIGCVAMRKIDSHIAELKRMYVKPQYQQQGIGKELLKKAIVLAKKCGYNKIRLDTLKHMLPAIGLYKKAGFYEIPPYYFNPITSAVFFETVL